MAIESQGIQNPYTFGFIGSSDTHTGTTSDDEANFFSKLGLLDSLPELRSSVPLSFAPAAAVRFFAPELYEEVDGEAYIRIATPTYGASGLAGVWAEENTRKALYSAFRRKETFATSGPRIRLRFFAGYDFSEVTLDAPGAVARAYETGVTMGGQLPLRADSEPQFIAWALADAQSAPLQRLQIIKGWIDSQGETHELVHDVDCSGGAVVDPNTLRCPDNGARVRLEDCGVENGSGASQLRTIWQDPNFDPSMNAFYYARVLENPTCRWSTWDAIRADVEPRPDLPKTLQERAWSTPIWFRESLGEAPGGPS